MFCLPENPAQRRYALRMGLTALLCVLFSSVAALVFRFGHPHGIPAYLVAILPALPIMGALVVTGLYLAEEKDEFQANLLVQSLLGGMGATLAATTVWGYMEDFANVPHLNLVWVYPFFWIFVALSIPVVKSRYR